MNHIGFFMVHIGISDSGDEGNEAFNRYGHTAEMDDKALYRYKKASTLGAG
ncbi:hypothetical protein [Photobacterium rosenbergii]|uniref:Uncharacterized protein n=1 Tax=Photobacterium rosenbergii TaxID=294936 RepID=A0ABU3ZHL6_9GAMM|nr:hypothetical protein [Photobacterium rosenbergii]MDV5169393.1 hypothetical protein [Photobacterium rosenbergii]